MCYGAYPDNRLRERELENNMTETEFRKWFAGADLGALEDVRIYVEAHAIQNCNDNFEVAKATVELYVDDPDLAVVFDDYRR